MSATESRAKELLMLQPNPDYPLTDMGRNRASVETLDRRRFSRRWRNWKKPRPEPIPDAQRKITPKEFKKLKKKDDDERQKRKDHEERRLERLLFLFKGRREQVLRAFEHTGVSNQYTTTENESLAYQKRTDRILAGEPEFIAQGPIPDLEKVTPYVFSFELWLLEEKFGCREKAYRPVFGRLRAADPKKWLEFSDVWHWWCELSWREQLDKMILQRDQR